MTNQSPPIVFFGTEEFSAVSLQALLGAGTNIVGVVTKPDSPRGRGQQLAPPRVKMVAAKHQIQVLQPHDLSEIVEFVSSLDNPAGVLVSYGKMIPGELIDLFKLGIINLHPSLLPKYRGPSPIEAAILHGDRETGVTIMKLEDKMDAGPIYLQQKIALKGSETRLDLYDKLASIGASGLARSLPLILEGRLQAHPQTDQNAVYCPLLSKELSLIDPVTTSATEAERQIRAYLGFPRSRMMIAGQNCIVLSAHVVQSSPSQDLSLQCSDGAFLVIDQLIAPSGKTVSGTDFKRGYL